MRRTGLSKRKRVTEGSSKLSDASVWHSTPVEELNIVGDPEIDNSPVQSSAKRIALANRPVNTAIRSTPLVTPCVTPIVRSVNASPSPVVISAPSGHTIFSSILQRHGYIVGQHRNHLQFDCMQFRKRMFEWVKQEGLAKHRVESDLEKFISAMKVYFSKKDTLRSAMAITLLKDEEIQPPLLHCLLGVENLQPHVVKSLMPILIELSLSTLPEDVYLAESTLKQMMYLPDITDGSALLSGLLECLENGLTPVQKHIIHAIPIILPPKYHEEIVDKMLPIFEKFSNLVSAFVNSFSTLKVDNEIMNERIRSSALEKMVQTQISDLPVFFSYLFGTDNSDALADAISSIRQNLVIRPAKKDSKHEAYLVEIIEKLRFFISFRKDIVSIWTKQVKDDTALGGEGEMKPIDLVVLLIIAESCTTNTSALHMLLENRKLTMEMLNELIQHTKPIIFQLFPTLFNICESILSEKRSKLFPVVSDILQALFKSLSPFEGQTIVFNLSSLVISGSSACQDAALKIFSDIAKQEPKKLQMFAANLMGIWDHKVKFTNYQIRSLMDVLATVAHIPGSCEVNTFKSEFNILLRKQLSHYDLAMRCCGVMGALATVRQLGQDDEPAEDDEIKNLLHLTWTFVERDKDTCRIFFDELAECVDYLPTPLCVYYRELLKSKFEDTWTVQDVESQRIPNIGRGELELSVAFDANKEMEVKTWLVFEEKPMSLCPVVLPSHLRVLTALENKVSDNNLEEIDAILGLPILFPTVSKYYDKEDLKGLDHRQKIHLGHYLVLAINFFRESLSSFVNETVTELRVKIWLRLRHVVQLQKILVKHCAEFPSLPAAYMTSRPANALSAFGSAAGPSSAITGLKKKNKRKPTKRRGKAKKGKNKGKKKMHGSDDSEQEEESESDHDEDEYKFNDSGSEEEKVSEGVVATKNLVNEIQPKLIFPYLRWLDAKVFSLLKFPLSLDPVAIDFAKVLDSIATEASMNLLRDIEIITPETLAFLLSELNWQTLETTNKFDILQVEDLLNSLLCHMETIIAAYDSVGEDCLAEEKQTHAEACFRLLINSLTVYFDAVAAFEGKEGRKTLIANNVMVIAARRAPGSATTTDELPISEVTKHVAEYLANIAEYVIEPSTAVDHLKLLKNVHDLLDDKEEMKSAVDSVIKTYLSKNWKLPSAQITFFLKNWLSISSNPIKVIHGIASSLIPPECAEGAQIPCTDFYKTCNKGNFQTWFSIMVSGLSHHVYKYGRKRGDYDHLLSIWSDAMDVLKILVMVAQKAQKKIILIPLLKNTRVFLEAFTIGGATMLPELWKRDPERAQTFCRELQHPTRRIQYVCEHSKVSKDPSMVRYVPVVKRTLERLVFRIREILSMQGVSCAFWMGSLKHRSLDGDIMNSQPFAREDGASNSHSVFDLESEDDTVTVDIDRQAESDREENFIVENDNDESNTDNEGLEDAVSDKSAQSDSNMLSENESDCKILNICIL